MEIVIKIPESIIEHLKDGSFGARKEDRATLVDAVMNGTPLPKGHGRIIDESKIHTVYEHTEEHINSDIKYIRTRITHTDAPTIIEGQYGIASEPFINKPCVSEGVCREDKMQVLDKIRAEIVELRSRQNAGVMECLDIIDKYRTEVARNDEI